MITGATPASERQHIDKAHTHERFTAFFWDYPGEPVPQEIIFSTLRYKGRQQRQTPTDQPDGRHSIEINQRPTTITPHFYAGYPSCRTATTLSSLGTGTKYAGVHTQWRGYIDKANLTKWLLLVSITENQRQLFTANIQVNLYLLANNPS